jgi:hypothetical protein
MAALVIDIEQAVGAGWLTVQVNSYIFYLNRFKELDKGVSDK